MENNPQDASEGKAVVAVLAAVLEKLVKSNSHVKTGDNVTKFHALKAPAISIEQYLERIHKYASCSTECFILALIYIDRLIQRNDFILSELNVHRVCVTAILLAAKFFDDAYYNNAYYAKVGGVLVSEMNGLEVEFLFRINFSLHVTPDVFVKYQEELISHAVGAGLERPTEVSVPQCVQPPVPVPVAPVIPSVPIAAVPVARTKLPVENDITIVCATNMDTDSSGWNPVQTKPIHSAPAAAPAWNPSIPQTSFDEVTVAENRYQDHCHDSSTSIDTTGAGTAYPRNHRSRYVTTSDEYNHVQRHITPSPPLHQRPIPMDDQDCSSHQISLANSAPGELHRSRSNLFQHQSLHTESRPRHNSFPVDVSVYPADAYTLVHNHSHNHHQNVGHALELHNSSHYHKKQRMHVHTHVPEVLQPQCSHFGRQLSPATTPSHLVNITRGVYQQ